MPEEVERLTLGRALAELERRNAGLTAGDLREAPESMPKVEAVVWHRELASADVRAAAERIARSGRKARVYVTIICPDPERLTLDTFGGSALLREFAVDGGSVRLVSER